MTREQMARLFNEWMRRYTEDPSSFEAEFRTVSLFLAEQTAGREPSYGEETAEYFMRLHGELFPPPAAEPWYASPDHRVLQGGLFERGITIHLKGEDWYWRDPYKHYHGAFPSKKAAIDNAIDAYLRPADSIKEPAL